MTTMALEELEQSGERELGTSLSVKVDQRHIGLLADATGAHQFHIEWRRRSASSVSPGSVGSSFLAPARGSRPPRWPAEWRH
jgi:hypothetical protein